VPCAQRRKRLILIIQVKNVAQQMKKEILFVRKTAKEIGDGCDDNIADISDSFFVLIA
jgi:hypothetical protein